MNSNVPTALLYDAGESVPKGDASPIGQSRNHPKNSVLQMAAKTVTLWAMRVAIIGANGMLGQDLMAACRQAGVQSVGYDLPDVDITRDGGGLEKIEACDWVVNCAAYTNVDGAESHRDVAFAVNGDGAGRVATWCAKKNIPLVHISTDYVFDGLSANPYRENDPLNPLSAYGESKLAGEKGVQAAGGRYLIVRTQSLFGIHGKNFVRAILGRLEKGGTPLRVVTDQVSSPTYTVHLADAILRLMKTGQQGIVHVSASGHCSWYEFACAIVKHVRPWTEVQKTTSAEYKSPARRPANSVLDKSLYESWTGHTMPSWQAGLDQYLEQSNKEAAGQPV